MATMLSSISSSTRVPYTCQRAPTASRVWTSATRPQSGGVAQANTPRAALPAAMSQASMNSKHQTLAFLRPQQSLMQGETQLDAVIPLESSAQYKQLLLFLALSGGLVGMTEQASAVDTQSLAAIDSSQVIQFLVNNPFVTLGFAVAAYFIVPRLIRVAVKFVLVPVAIGGVGYLIVTNPSTSLGFAKSTVGYVLANPAITSIAILTALALVLSPYVLVIGGVFLLFSAASLPGPLKRILPGPVVEAEKQLNVVRQQVKGPVNSIKDSLFGKGSKALAPGHLDASRLLSAPKVQADDQQQQ